MSGIKPFIVCADCGERRTMQQWMDDYGCHEGGLTVFTWKEPLPVDCGRQNPHILQATSRFA